MPNGIPLPTIYLDDNADGNLLITALTNAGFIVISPRQTGTKDSDDDEHLNFAAAHGHVLLTNDAEFRTVWHPRHIAAGGHHAGVLVYYTDNDVHRDMQPGEIVRSIKNLLHQFPRDQLRDQLFILNEWRY